MKKLSTLMLVLCATVVLASSAWSVNLPFYNQSFEIYEMVDGFDFSIYGAEYAGNNYSGTDYPVASGWVWAQPPLGQSLEVVGAPDGDRVALISNPLPDGTYHYNSGIWGEANGIPYTVQPGETYTVSVQVSKVPGMENDSGYMKIILGEKGTWDGSVQSIELAIPQQTQEGVWTTYSRTWNSDDYPAAYGKYISVIQLFVYGPAESEIGLYYDDVRIDGPGGVIPEPGSLLAFSSGLFGLMGFAIRRRK